MENYKDKLVKKTLGELDEDATEEKKFIQEERDLGRRPYMEHVTRPAVREKTLAGTQEILLSGDEESLLDQQEFTLSKTLRGRELSLGEKVILQSNRGEINAEVLSTKKSGLDIEGNETTYIELRLV